MKILNNIRIGKAQVSPSKPSHTPGVAEGNTTGAFEADPGMYPTGEQGAGRPTGKATARRSTSINPHARNPIDPKSPNLPPA